MGIGIVLVSTTNSLVNGFVHCRLLTALRKETEFRHGRSHLFAQRPLPNLGVLRAYTVLDSG